MVDYELKKEELDLELGLQELDDVFEFVEMETCGIYYGEQELGNSICNITITIDDTCATCIRYSVCKLENMDKRYDIIELLNAINVADALNKAYLDKENTIIIEFNYYSDEQYFNAETLVETLVGTYVLIKDIYYKKIMKIMWA